MKIVDTHTGKIFVDPALGLESLTVGDYGKENNIKASFLGLDKEIHGVQHHDVDLTQKWVATISTQKGCCMKCKFCDCPTYGYHGNVSLSELEYEVRTILVAFPNIKHTKRFNVHFARMGEPTFNPNVLDFAARGLRQVVSMYIDADTIHPVVSTMLPASNAWLEPFLMNWCWIKNESYEGEAGLQFSIQSTDEEQRNKQFNGLSHSLPKIAGIADRLPMPIGRKYTLNFAVTGETILNAKELDLLFDKNKFIVKITPIHETNAAISNGFDVGDTYTDYDVYKKFEEPLLESGWDVIVFVPSKEEDSDRITCGNALIAETRKADQVYMETQELPLPPTEETADIAQRLLSERFGNIRNHVHYHATRGCFRCSGDFENIGLHCEAATKKDAYYNLCDGLIRIFCNKQIKTRKEKQKWEPDLAKLTQNPCTR